MRIMAHLALRAAAPSKQSISVLTTVRPIFSTAPRHSSTNKDEPKQNAKEISSGKPQEKPSQSADGPQRMQSMAQADEDLRRRLEEMSGEGGAAGIEYEDGKPQAMKRSVRNNMFRYI
ncbi:hypothetical protein BJX68DRAFT_29995 [Aspergillus pseudodeflectus]|uniref:Uncharacterized protein n=1 Tax=Aspergillus pseudodeflectus TaxID=176178 RepID=A0ABR4KQK6_9EURO